MNAPILNLADCARQVAIWRQQGLRVAFTNGHFDLLHAGHVNYLQAARGLADRLVVGLNDDASTRRRKGPTRPILPQEERALLLAALRPVDAVIIWPEDDFCDVVAALKPDFYIKGADWNGEQGPKPPEAKIIEAQGGAVLFIELTPGRSTTTIEQEILARRGCSPEAGA